MPAERRRRRHARNGRTHDSTGKKRGAGAMSRRRERQEARGAHCSRSSISAVSVVFTDTLASMTKHSCRGFRRPRPHTGHRHLTPTGPPPSTLRLLRQPHGFEGFERLVEPREANDPAVTNVEHVATRETSHGRSWVSARAGDAVRAPADSQETLVVTSCLLSGRSHSWMRMIA
jgi:hypothetical protein